MLRFFWGEKNAILKTLKKVIMKTVRLEILILLFFMVQAIKAVAQMHYIDSLKSNVRLASTDARKLEAIQVLFKQNNSLHGDTILKYVSEAGLLAEKIRDVKMQRLCEYMTIMANLAKGKTDSVLYKLNNSPLLKFNKQQDTFLYYKIHLLRAGALNRMNERTKALDLQLRILDEAEKDDYTLARVYFLNYTGATYYNLGKINDAKRYYMEGLALVNDKPATELKEIELVIYSNLILCYGADYIGRPANSLGDTILALAHKIEVESRQHSIYWMLASGLSMQGSLYAERKDYQLAEKKLSEAVAIRELIGDPLYLNNELANLASFYNKSNNYDKAINIVERIIQISSKAHLIEGKGAILGLLSIAYKGKGDYKAYSTALEQFIAVLDSSAKLNAADKLAEIQTKYEVQKKEALILQQKYALLRRNFFLYGAIVLALMIAGISIYRLKKYQQQQQAVHEQRRLENEAAIKDAEENERKRIAAELHDNLGVQANAILHNSNQLQQSGNDNNNSIISSLKETAKEMLLNLRETLWAMKTTDVTASDLWLRVISFMKQMGRHYPAISFRIEGLPPETLSISSAQALNIVLVIQETVNNSVKHASAQIITAASIFDGHGWKIEIKDNGKGFDTELNALRDDAFGLKNITERAVQGRFSFKLSSTPGAGTVAEIAV
jgi:signal transduction histidine kinase